METYLVTQLLLRAQQAGPGNNILLALHLPPLTSSLTAWVTPLPVRGSQEEALNDQLLGTLGPLLLQPQADQFLCWV